MKVIIDGIEYMPTRNPLAYVENKLVHTGDELWIGPNCKHKITGMKQFKDTPETVYFECGNYGYIRADRFSWNPQKPRTIMIEVLRDDAEWIVRAYGGCNSKAGSLAESCREALDKC